MGWDVMIFNTRGKKPPPIEQFEEEFYEPLGPAIAVRERLSDLIPGIDWSDSTWGMYSKVEYCIEFSIGAADPIECMMLHVHGSGDAISSIVAFAKPLGWSALDLSTMEFLDLEQPSREGWEGFQAFCNKVIDQNSDKEETQE